jgi:predicted NBD/HSP70 family sugar kinase
LIDTILVFDLGGTNLRAGSFDLATGTITCAARIASDVVREGADSVRALHDALADLACRVGDGAPRAVGMAVPGPVHNGVAGKLPSLLGPSYDGHLDFQALGEGLWPGARVYACNDLTAAGQLYVARGGADFGVLTLGSGVGGKLFVNGRPLLGRAGYGGEIGHWRVPGAAPIACDCGGVGHLSALASGRGVVRLARWTAEQNPEAFAQSSLASLGASALTAPAITAAFNAGDRWAADLMLTSAQALGAGIAACALAAGLERFFLTGGFAVGAGEAYRALVAQAAGEHAWSFGVDWQSAITLAAPDEEPGLIGAGFYALAALAREADAIR